MQTARDVLPLGERQQGNRSLDFSNRAHVGKLSAMRIGVNAVKRYAVKKHDSFAGFICGRWRRSHSAVHPFDFASNCPQEWQAI
jgi:hypothetical protein